jgi:hydrogenase expression/formation protein HypE
MQEPPSFSLTCPVPITDHPHVLLAHGGGGRLMRQLIADIFAASFADLALQSESDSAVVDVGGARLAFTTDSFVVHPLFFPGGDIGSLAIHGTVNDLATAGARPRFVSVGFIIEEGLPVETLWRVAQSMRAAAEACGVSIATGDTKVVDRGKADRLFINTSGIGVVEHDQHIHAGAIRPGDAVLVSGDLGRHGIAVMAVREGLEFESEIESDSAPLHEMVLALLAEGLPVHCLRDLTRGGLASALNEIAEAAGVCIHVHESQIPVRGDVRGACEILGLDPLYVANEGRMAVVLPEAAADRALAVMRSFGPGEGACRIGRVDEGRAGRVHLTSALGSVRILDMLSGEQLPRIC